jgi:hypothetical protein
LHIQELKSQQQALPAAVVALVRQLNWLPAQLQACVAAADAQEQQQQQRHAIGTLPETTHTQTAGAAGVSPPGRSIGHVPGLTITSFYLEQLQASKQVTSLTHHESLVA